MAYVGFKKLAAETSPAIAASIGRKKYGKKKFDKAASEGKKLKGAKPASKYASGKSTRSGKMMAKAKANSQKKKNGPGFSGAYGGKN